MPTAGFRFVGGCFVGPTQGEGGSTAGVAGSEKGRGCSRHRAQHCEQLRSLSDSSSSSSSSSWLPHCYLFDCSVHTSEWSFMNLRSGSALSAAWTADLAHTCARSSCQLQQLQAATSFSNAVCVSSKISLTKIVAACWPVSLPLVCHLGGPQVTGQWPMGLDLDPCAWTARLRQESQHIWCSYTTHMRHIVHLQAVSSRRSIGAMSGPKC